MKAWRAMIGLVVVLALSLTVSVAQDEATASACSADAPHPEPGMSERQVESGGRERTVIQYIPEDYDPTEPAPLVLSFHGFAMTPTMQAQASQWHVLGEEMGFITLYPAGTGFPPRWNAGETARQQGTIDDVAFVRDLISETRDTLCIDAERIYATGFSNGGGLSHRLACELSGEIAAIGVVAGAFNPLPEGCHPERPVPVMAFHGTEDHVVPFLGGDGDLDLPVTEVLPPIETWVSEWAARNGCDETPEALPASGEVSGLQYSDCDADAGVILYVVEGGGHTWPGSTTFAEIPYAPALGLVTMDIDATAVMWDFFERVAVHEAAD